MNIFYTNNDPRLCAMEHVDKHTVKMILEYNQLLSTAHRVLDGKQVAGLSASGRKKKVWKLDSELDSIVYSATHINHPSAVWVRQSSHNYMWLGELVSELSKEYTHRYGKVHKCERDGLLDVLYNNVPKNIPKGTFTEPTPAMPSEYIVKGNSIQSYINYINGAKQHLHSWKNRKVPYFIRGK